MPTEHDKIADAFHHTYQRMVDRVQLTEPEWPPVSTIGDITPPAGRFLTGWKIAVAALLITGSFWVGWLVAPGQATRATDPFQVQTETTTAVAVPDTESIPHPNPAEAAIAAALAQAPDLTDARVTRIVGIYADDTMVDLRVQIQANEYCHWFGVTGYVRESALEWRGGPALPCDQ